MSLVTRSAADVFLPVTTSGQPRGADMAEVRTWAMEVQRLAVAAAQSGGALIYETRTALFADLAKANNSMAWVLADPIPARNGVYRKSGASGAGVWVYSGQLSDQDAISSALADVVLSMGDRYDDIISAVSATNGASSVAVDSRNLGLTIPSGSSGVDSSIVGFIPMVAELPLLVGRTVVIRAVYDASVNFLAEKPYTAVALLVDRGAGAVAAGTLTRMEQSGTRIISEVSYVVTSSDRSLGPVYQIAAAGNSTAHDHEITLIGASLRAANVPQLQVATLSDEAVSVALRRFKELNQISPLGLGIDLSDAAPLRYLTGGAVARADGNGLGWGVTTPVGQTGYSSYIQSVVPIDLTDVAGAEIQVRFGLQTSSDWARGFGGKVMSFRAADGSPLPPVSMTSREVQVAPDRREVTIRAPIPAGAVGVQPYIVQGGSGVAATSEEFWLVTDIHYDLVTGASARRSASDDTAMLREARLAAAIGSQFQQGGGGAGSWSKTVTVKASGGDHTTVKAAVEAIVDATALKRYRVLIDPGIYTDIDWHCKDYVDLVARGAGVWFKGELPDNHPPADILNHSTINLTSESVLIGIKVTCRNMRYPIHADSNGSLPDRTARTIFCHVEHLGNKGAFDYQTSISGSPGSVWVVESGWGSGNASGVLMDSEGTTFRNGAWSGGGGGAFLFHTNGHFDAPTETRLTNCTLSCGVSGAALVANPLGTGQIDRLIVNGCEIDGDILYTAGPWMPAALADQPSDHTEIDLVGAGNSPAVFTITDFGRALRITSADVTSASLVAVSGTAAAVLFGREVYSLPGSGGMAGYVYGWADVSGAAVGPSGTVLITSMGHRLGDCSTINKTLSVAFQGGSPIDIVFSANMTGVSNATILSTINAALGSAGAASLYASGERYRPKLTDEERDMNNGSAVAIPFGSACAYGATSRDIRLMTSADTGALFAGIAWQDIYPGQRGRVKKAGYLPMADIRRTDGAAFARGDTFSVDAGTPGAVYKGGSQGLLPAIRTNAVRVVT